MDNIRTTVESLTQAFETFKAANDERLNHIEKKSGTSESEEKMQRLDQEVTRLSDQLESLRVTTSRPELQLKDVDNSADTHQTAVFCDYVRKGEEQALAGLEHKTLSVGSDPDGGYLVPPAIVATIRQGLAEQSPMRRLAQVMTIATDAVEMLVDKNYADVGWVGETQQRSETKTPDLARKRIAVHEMYAKPKATQKLLDDANINVEEWLANKVASRMAVIENHAFLWGNGSTKPRGILAYDIDYGASTGWGKLQGFRTGADNDFSKEKGADVLIDVVAALRPEFQQRAVWLMSRSAVSNLRKLKDKSGMYLWQPGLEGDLRPKLLGYPIEIFEHLPDQGETSQPQSILFGDFGAGYMIVDRQGTRVLRDPFSVKPYVEFYTTRRVGGGVINYDALKVLNFSKQN
ncbi:MAG: phage major capsid protein [Pseudomonadota bacterium]